MNVVQLRYKYIKENVDEFKSFLYDKLRITRLNEFNKNIDVVFNNEDIKKNIESLIKFLNGIMCEEVELQHDRWLKGKINKFVDSYLQDMDDVEKSKEIMNRKLKSTTFNIIKEKIKTDYKEKRNEISLAMEGLLTIYRDRQTNLKAKNIVTSDDVNTFLNHIDILLWFYDIISFLIFMKNGKIFLSVRYISHKTCRNFITILNNLQKGNNVIDWLEAYYYIMEMLCVLY